MTCQQLVEFLMDYLDGTLPEPQRGCFEEHLAECPDCVAYLATYQETIRMGKAVCAEDSDALPPEIPEELVQAIVTARSRETGRPPPENGSL
jgi:anti-sigma factor RsiW